MNNKKNSLAVTLMLSSIFLLLILQFFWLRNSYEKAYFDLRTETNHLFRTTVFALRDSLFIKNIERVPFDSSVLNKKDRIFFSQKIDTVKLRAASGTIGHIEEAGHTVQLYISSSAQPDSVRSMLKPLVSRIRGGHMDGQSFIVRFNPENLSADSIRTHFRKALDDAGIAANFKTIHISFPPPVPTGNIKDDIRLRHEALRSDRSERASPFSDTIFSETARIEPGQHFSFALYDFRQILIREIAPQILFSVFLTLLTSAAFIIMYRSIRSQQRLMELKNDFISNITHELKTPVTTVSVALEALKNFKGLENPQLTQEYLNIAQGELNRLTLLTDKILKTAVFENKGMSFEPEPVDLYKTVEQILHSMKLVFDKQKAQVNFQKSGDSFVIQGGSVHLTNVIYNLLDNAMKYSGGEPKITISLEEEANRVVLKVADNGIGIPSEYRKKIFEKFFRVPTGDVHNIKGYGLGLSYVDNVIKSHHGTIEVNSQPGEGSIFTIFLPKNRAVA